MGQKRKEQPSVEEMYATISRMLVPENILSNFDIYGAENKPKYWVIEMREKPGRIPVELSGIETAEVVFDGYENPIETLSHSFVCKPVYLRVYRRRYKQRGSTIHYSNSYDLTLKGVKMVPELGLFLKAEYRKLQSRRSIGSGVPIRNFITADRVYQQ
jgi:hypothetical protein